MQCLQSGPRWWTVGLSLCVDVCLTGVITDFGMADCVVDGRSLADVDNNGSLSMDEFCVAMHLVDMTKHGHTLPAVLPLDLVPPVYRTSAVHSPLLTTPTMNKPLSSAPHAVMPGLIIDENISTVKVFIYVLYLFTV